MTTKNKVCHTKEGQVWQNAVSRPLLVKKALRPLWSWVSMPALFQAVSQKKGHLELAQNSGSGIADQTKCLPHTCSTVQHSQWDWPSPHHDCAIESVFVAVWGQIC
jgi:hypothetical protein